MTRTFTRREWGRKGWPFVLLHTHTVEIPKVLGIEQDLALNTESTGRVVGDTHLKVECANRTFERQVGRGWRVKDSKSPAVSSFKSVDVCLVSGVEWQFPTAKHRRLTRGFAARRRGARREHTSAVLRDENLVRPSLGVSPRGPNNSFLSLTRTALRMTRRSPSHNVLGQRVTLVSRSAVPVRDEAKATSKLAEPSRTNVHDDLYVSQVSSPALSLSLVRGSSEVERVAHNHDVAGSIPAPATTPSWLGMDTHDPLDGTRTHTPASTSLMRVLP